MSAIVNPRDLILQAADPRLLPVALPSNVVIQDLLDLANDDKLTPGKRQMYRAQWDVMASEKAGIDAQAALFEVSPAAYDAAWMAWATYFNGGAAWVAGVPALLADASLSAATTDVSGAALRGVLTAHAVERAALLAAIATKARTLAVAAQSTADAKLSAGSSYVLGGVVSVQDTGGLRAGTVTWDAATGLVTSGSGVVLTKAGLIGVKAGVPTFTVTTAGDATFSGNVVTGGDAYFSGKSPGTANIYLGGETRSIDYSAWANAQTNASEYAVRAGFVGYASAAVSDYNIGVIGKGNGAGRGIGVVGEGAFLGGYFVSTSASGNGVEAVNTAGGVAVACFGSFRWGAYTIQAPDGVSTEHYFCKNGTWRVPEYEIPIACSDETSNLTIGAGKVTFRIRSGKTLLEVGASLTEAPAGSALIVDINKNGASILSTKLSIDAGEKSSATASVPAIISDASLPDDAEISIDIDQVGSTSAGKGLKVYLKWKQA